MGGEAVKMDGEEVSWPDDTPYSFGENGEILSGPAWAMAEARKAKKASWWDPIPHPISFSFEEGAGLFFAFLGGVVRVAFVAWLAWFVCTH